MGEQITVSLISGILTLIGVIITTVMSHKKNSIEFKHQQELFNTRLTEQLDAQNKMTTMKIDDLASEVREHNNFARRMPVVEEQIKVINHRLDNLEKKG